MRNVADPRIRPARGPGRSFMEDTAPPPRKRRIPRLAAASAITVLLALVAVPGAGVARAPEPETPPGVDEIASSPNLTQVAHLPKDGPFANSANTDWAFRGHYAFGGNYNGFTVFDIRDPKAPTVVAQVLCPGSQNDVSISGDLL